MKKPVQNEIVKGADIYGKSFDEGMVKGSTETVSLIQLSDGSETVASHQDIKGQLEP